MTSQFSGNTDSDSKGDSSATEGPIQSRTPSIWNTAICGTACPPSWPSSMSSIHRLASSHQISLGFHQLGTGSPSRESGERRIHSPWRSSNIPPWHCYSRGAPYFFFSIYLGQLYTILSFLLQWLHCYCLSGLSQRSGCPDLGSSDLSPFGRQYHFPMLLFIAWSFSILPFIANMSTFLV